MSDQISTFYNQLAADYHFIFADWRKSVLRQSEVLDKLIRAQTGSGGRSVLDCSCGIGTQAIGLAVRGYTVHATDLSPDAVERARREAAHFKVDLTFGVADFRALAAVVEGTFDVVLSCDNSLAHMLTEAELQEAFASMYAKVQTGGLLLLSIRDYDQTILDKPHSTLPTVSETDGERNISFQVWDWSEDGKSYTLNHFTVKQNGADWDTSNRVTQLHAWQRSEFNALLEKVGFTNIDWHMPPNSGYYQPIVTAKKPS